MPNESSDKYHASQMSILHFKSIVGMLLDMLLSHPSAQHHSDNEFSPVWHGWKGVYDNGTEEARGARKRCSKTRLFRVTERKISLGLLQNCCRRKQIQNSLCVLRYRSHLYNSFLQAVSSKGRIRTIKIRIFSVKNSESTNNSGKFTEF